MRIIHTSDWHIGRTLGGYSLLEDQAFFLRQLLNFIKEYSVEALLISGDLYHSSLPSAAAVSLLNDFFTEAICDAHLKIFVIAGNHDSPQRIDYAQKILQKSFFYLEGKIHSQIRRIMLTDSICITMLPYFDPIEVKRSFDAESIVSYNDAAIKIYQMTLAGRKRFPVEILMAHGFFMPLQYAPDHIIYSDSELRVGEMDVVSLNTFTDFDYIALGHLHAPQQISKNAFYAGSPLKYSVGEASQKKGIRLLDITDDNKIHSKHYILPVLRDIKVITGFIHDLLQKSSDDYVFIYLQDKEYMLHAVQLLKEKYPHILGLKYIHLQMNEREVFAYHQTGVPISAEKLFEKFYEESAGEKMTKKEKEILEAVIQEVQSANS